MFSEKERIIAIITNVLPIFFKHCRSVIIFILSNQWPPFTFEVDSLDFVTGFHALDVKRIQIVPCVRKYRRKSSNGALQYCKTDQSSFRLLFFPLLFFFGCLHLKSQTCAHIFYEGQKGR